MRTPDPAVFAGVPMSTGQTGAVQRQRLLAAGFSVADLPVLTDVDTIDDAYAVALACPGTRFAAVLARVGNGTALRQ